MFRPLVFIVTIQYLHIEENTHTRFASSLTSSELFLLQQKTLSIIEH